MLFAVLAASSPFVGDAAKVACFPMELDDLHQNIVESVSGKKFSVQGANAPYNVPGAKGLGLRLDGYSEFVEASIDNSRFDEPFTAMTVSLWCAVETYPIMAHDSDSSDRAMIAGNIDKTARTGFAFYLGRDGKYSFECYSGGWLVTCQPEEKLPCYRWNNLVAVVDGANRQATLYNNGKVVYSGRCMESVDMATGKFMIGRSEDAVLMDGFSLNNFNGIIDDICIYDEALSATEIAGWTAENEADLSIPSSRYDGNIYRPKFHGMPGQNWTNESHGMMKYGGKYHVFFQKNANGPYMSRLQWGHIVSTDLLTWSEEPIALFADEVYDTKGCWSGCVFTDDYLTAGKPAIFYTAVDYARATICRADPIDDGLVGWEKYAQNPVVDGRPDGLSDDFRDPYVFRNGDNYYMVVGTSKDGVGATTLHRYDKATATWSNDGSIFFRAASKNISGRFWEMPTVTPMGDGKWLFTTTPLETGAGVETQYWVGTINSDGSFSPLSDYASAPGKVELEGFGKDGFGLLSPSIMQADGKTVVIGIVPDKLPSSENYKLGWAHNYSLPREWSLDGDNRLVQKPWDGLKKLRTQQSFVKSNVSVDGSQSLQPVGGRKIEFSGEFVIGSASKFGFNFLKKGDKQARLYYSPVKNTLTLDVSALDRIVNDAGVFDGVYESALPETFSQGEIIKIHAFVDNSIIDIFVNDKWAASVRVFASDGDADGVEVFSEGGSTEMRSIEAYNLDEEMASAEAIVSTEADGCKVAYGNGTLRYSNAPAGAMMERFSIQGKLLEREKLVGSSGEVVCRCEKGVYIVAVSNHKERKTTKIIVR